MKINLSIPPLSTDPVEFVQINPGTLASDLATLPRDDFLYTGHRILNDLEQFNKASVDDELRLKLLDLYRVSILNLAKSLRKSIGKSNLPVNKKLLTKLNITLDLTHHPGWMQLVMLLDKLVLHPDSLAKYFAAFFRMSRSCVTRRRSAFRRRISSSCSLAD